MKFKCIINAMGLMTALFILTPKIGNAQGISPKLLVQSSYLPTADLSDTLGGFSSRSISVGWSIPVMGKMLDKGGDTPSFFMVMANGAFETKQVRFEAFKDRTFIRPWLGSSFVYNPGNKVIFMGNIALRWLKDSEGGPGRLIPTGLAIASVRQSPTFSFLLGAAYTFNFGSGMPFPLLGFRKTFKESSNLSVMLPLSITYNVKPSARFGYSLFLKPQGDIDRYRAGNSFQEIEQDHLVLRERAIKVGASASFAFGAFSVLPEIGVLGGREIVFAEEGGSIFNPQNLFKSAVDPGFYFNLKLQINLRNTGAGNPLEQLSSVGMDF